jgi:ABC-2 type transport system ATP-binding protein
MIKVEHLGKVYPIAIKEPGLAGTIKHFWQRQYREVAAVTDISFSLEPGEIVGFLGANGAGKTTTLKMLTGLIHPSSGKVTVAGHIPFRRESSFLQKVTLVMGQKQQLLWDLPALDSLRINAAVYNIPDRLFRDRLHTLTEMLSLEDKLSQPLRKLSLGERMKAELLAALLHQPQVLFLDEPTLGLDVNAQANVRAFLKQYNQEFGATILLTSHYMADITALCHRVLLIHQGSLIFDGNLEHLLERFAPFREIRVELESVPEHLDTICQEILPKDQEDQDLNPAKSSVEIDGRSLRFLIHRPALIATATKILTTLPVADLAIAEPPIDAVIGKVFQTGKVS